MHGSNGYTRGRLVLVGERVYDVFILGAQDYHQDEAEDFIKSFQIVELKK